MNDLGLLRIAQARYSEAEPIYLRALEIRENRLGPVHPDLAITLENYAALLSKMGRTADASTLVTRANAIRDIQTKSNSSD